jgi:hypothetical protein
MATLIQHRRPTFKPAMILHHLPGRKVGASARFLHTHTLFDRGRLNAQRCPGTRHEPSVARAVFAAMLANAGVEVWHNVTLGDVRTDQSTGAISSVDIIFTTNSNHNTTRAFTTPTSSHTAVRTRNTTTQPLVPGSTASVPSRAKSAISATTTTVVALVHVDASYFGDFLAASGAEFRIGRESRAEFGEINAGVV